MNKEEFIAFRQRKRFPLELFANYYGLNESLIEDYESGAEPVPEFLSRRIAFEIFEDVMEAPANSREDKLDQLLNCLERLPNQGSDILSELDFYLEDAKENDEFGDQRKSFWIEFRNRYTIRMANPALLKLQLTIF